MTDQEIEQELKENPLRSSALGFWESLVKMYEYTEVSEKDLQAQFPGFYLMSQVKNDEEACEVLIRISNYERDFVKRLRLTEIQNKILNYIFSFKKENLKKEEKMNSFNESKLQEYFAELLFKDHLDESEIEKLKILSDVLKFIHENQIEESIANRKQEDYQRNFDRFMKYWKDSNIKDLLIEYLYKKLEKKND